MNVAAHQEKKKNEKMGKRKAGEKRRQVDLKKLRATPSTVVQGLHRKKMVCVRGVPGVTGTLGRANSHFDQTQMGFGTASQHTIYMTEILHFIIQKDRNQNVFWGWTEGL